MKESIEVLARISDGEETRRIEFEKRDDGWYISPPEELRNQDKLEYADDGYTETPYAQASASSVDVGQLLRKDYDTRY